MKCFAINLDRTPERWLSFSRATDAAGIAVERIAAADAEHVDPAAMQNSLGRSFLDHRLSRAEFACFLSHRMAWRKIAEGDDAHGVVFEDDLVFSPGIGRLLDDPGWVPRDADIVRLETFFRKTSYARSGARSIHGRAVRRLLGSDFGAAAYVISRACAKRLLEIRQIGDPVDEVMFNWKSPLHASLVIYQLDPAPCVQIERLRSRDAPAMSTIEKERRAAKKTGFAKLAHELRRIEGQLRHLPRFVAALAGTRRIVPFQ